MSFLYRATKYPQVYKFESLNSEKELVSTWKDVQNAFSSATRNLQLTDNVISETDNGIKTYSKIDEKNDGIAAKAFISLPVPVNIASLQAKFLYNGKPIPPPTEWYEAVDNDFESVPPTPIHVPMYQF